MNQNLSASLEDYLEVIAELTAQNGHAHTKEIADKLNVKMPSVTGALRQLERLNYIVYNAHYPVVLTEQGEQIAHEVIRRHAVLKSFFADVLGLPPEKASATACHLEHVVDADTIRRFVLFSKAIAQRKDACSLQNFLAEAMEFLSDEKKSSYKPLSELEVNTRGKVVQCGRNLAGMEETLPLREGDTFTLEGFSEAKDLFLVKKGRSVVEVTPLAAENLWVKEL